MQNLRNLEDERKSGQMRVQGNVTGDSQGPCAFGFRSPLSVLHHKPSPKMEDTAEIKTVVPPKVQRGFEVTRRKLVETLGSFTFMRVTVVTFPPCTMRTGTHFQGEAIEVFPGKHSRSAPRTAFFSRFARGQGFNVLGTLQIVDTPMGASHSTAIPQIGDILIGSIVDAKKGGKIPHELRGWSNNAKPLLELARIVQFGSRMSEKELATLLKQPGSAAAAFFLRLNPSLPPTAPERIAAEKSLQSVDDVWALARVVCFGKLDDDPTLKTSTNFIDLVDNLAMKFGDEALMDAWAKVRPEQYHPELSVAVHHPVYAQPMWAAPPPPADVGGASAAGPAWSPPAWAAPAPAPAWAAPAPAPPAWAAQAHPAGAGVVYQWSAPAPAPHAVVYHPSSPVYQPTSPVYAPKSPAYNPTSPAAAYQPTSPKAAPASPKTPPDDGLANDD